MTRNAIAPAANPFADSVDISKRCPAGKIRLRFLPKIVAKYFFLFNSIYELVYFHTCKPKPAPSCPNSHIKGGNNRAESLATLYL